MSIRVYSVLSLLAIGAEPHKSISKSLCDFLFGVGFTGDPGNKDCFRAGDGGFRVFLVSRFYTVNSGLPLFYVDVMHKSLSDFLCGVCLGELPFVFWDSEKSQQIEPVISLQISDSYLLYSKNEIL